jgi:hypothetical protein
MLNDARLHGGACSLAFVAWWTNSIGSARKEQIALYGASPFVVVADVCSAADVMLRTTGIVIDFAGFAYSMMLISPT